MNSIFATGGATGENICRDSERLLDYDCVSAAGESLCNLLSRKNETTVYTQARLSTFGISSPSPCLNLVMAEMTLDASELTCGLTPVDELVHIPGVSNTVADSLSRMFSPSPLAFSGRTCSSMGLCASNSCFVSPAALAWPGCQALLVGTPWRCKHTVPAVRMCLLCGLERVSSE